MLLQRMLHYTLSAMLVVGIIGLSRSVAAQSFQRLFTTPEQRAVLDRRRAGIEEPELLEEVSELIAELINVLPLELEEPVDQVYALQGVVRRSDNYYTVWLNNEAIDQQDLPENMELLTPYSQGRLRIRKPQTGEYFDMKPGQVLNLTRGQLLESYQVVPEPEEDTQSETPIQTETSALPSPAANIENRPGMELSDEEQLLFDQLLEDPGIIR